MNDPRIILRKMRDHLGAQPIGNHLSLPPESAADIAKALRQHWGLIFAVEWLQENLRSKVERISRNSITVGRAAVPCADKIKSGTTLRDILLTDTAKALVAIRVQDVLADLPTALRLAGLGAPREQLDQWFAASVTEIRDIAAWAIGAIAHIEGLGDAPTDTLLVAATHEALRSKLGVTIGAAPDGPLRAWLGMLIDTDRLASRGIPPATPESTALVGVVSGICATK